jgi:hypothetical protein
MSSQKILKKALKSITREEFVNTAELIVGDNSLSDEDFAKFDGLRKQYPAYDELCKRIQTNKDHTESSLLHASGMDLTFRVLINIAEQRLKQ